MHTRYVENARRSAQGRSIQATFREYSATDQIEPQIRAAQKLGAQALIVLPGPASMVGRREIIKVVQALRWPAIGWSPEFADDGLPLAYGPDFTAVYRRAAYYADRILRGAKPGDLPIEQPTTFQLVMNLKAAKAMGITFPQSFLVRADRVIE
jgi:putative ABC transport system substrate-binding protein